MKDSKKFSERTKKAYRIFKRKYGKIDKPSYDMSADSLVYAVVSERLAESAAGTAVKKLKSHFADWNDLRVSRVEEVVDVLGKDSESNQQLAACLTLALNAIFNKYDVVNLEGLAEAGKRQARSTLEKLLPGNRYVINYVMLTAFEGHAIPLTAGMVEYLKVSGLVHEESDQEEIEGFLERQIPANGAYEFYAMLRKESEGPNKKLVLNNNDKKNAKK